MPKVLKIVLILGAALVLVVSVAMFLLSQVDTQSRLEAIAAEATGLDFAVKGGVSIGIFPALHATLNNVTLQNKESQLASAAEADIGVEFWPLLRKQVRINRLTLRNVNIEVVRNRDGHFNFAPPQQSPQEKRLIPAMRLAHVSLIDANFRYINQQSDKELDASNCKLDSDDLQLMEGNSADIMKHLALSARIVCAEMRNNLFVGSDARFSIAGERGVFKIEPLTMKIMDGQGSGSLDADFTGELPAYRLHYAVTQLHVDNLFKSLAPGKAGEGFMDFTADLSMRGFDTAAMTRSTTGEASLRGKDLDIAIGDLDERLSNYESSQNFNLVDVGAFFIAGPLGTAVTKGYNFASIFQGAGGNTRIRILVSQWKVENGVAHAQDVAMATKENRIAMQGALDFVNKDFDDVTVAILDRKGCARIEQRIRGPFSKPEVEKPNVLASLTGPLRSLITKATKLMGAKCAVFYEGSVQP